MSMSNLDSVRPEKLQEFAALKRQAWEIKKATGQKHHRILNDMAIARGFKNWSMLALNWSKDPK